MAKIQLVLCFRQTKNLTRERYKIVWQMFTCPYGPSELAKPYYCIH